MLRSQRLGYRILTTAVLLLVVIVAGRLGNSGTIQAAPVSHPLGRFGAQAIGGMKVSGSSNSDVSAPLSTIPPLRNSRLLSASDGNENDTLPRRFSFPGTGDSALQTIYSPLLMPGTIANFDGEYNQYGPIPPDTNGDAGRSHYVQIVNSGFTIFNKLGSILYGPANNNTLFTGFGGICETTNSGDPVALYDPMADRWVLTWFTGQSNPTHQCFAVSAGPDPLGSWYRYDFVTSPITTAFEDYPHLGAWPDAYYMATNEFGTANGGGNYAFDRSKMLSGDPTASMIYIPSADSGLLPSDLDGNTPPPAGSPNYFLEWYDTAHLAEYKFHVDFTNPNLSTFTGPVLITVPSFAYPVCSASRERCVPQPGTTAQLEAIGDRLMYRVAYRNFGSYESIVLNHTVNATGINPGIAAPRWYELRDPGAAGGATLQQAGTYYPGDGIHRWMGSIAQDGAGDIAMGFSASGSTLFPSIRYAGRIPSDPPNTFGQGEATLFAGGGSEDFPSAPRWGDYSSISVDPVDDCTFWFTSEYFSQTGLRDWRTRIGSFKFPNCVAQNTATPTRTSTPATVTRTPTALPTQCAGTTSSTGSIANTDPVQTGRLGLSDPKSSCAVPKSVAALSDTLTRHYKTYTYANTSAGPQCVTVAITQNCGNNAVQSVAYLGTFDPSNIQLNYLADGGASGHTFSYSFTLPASQAAVVVVLEVSPNLGCTTYNLTINPCPPPVSTPTTTMTPTRTHTSTVTRTPSMTPSVTRTRTNTPTGTPTSTPTRILVGHAIWEGRPNQPDPLQQLPITLTLKQGTNEVNYPSQTTDASGFFTVSVTSLPTITIW